MRLYFFPSIVLLSVLSTTLLADEKQWEFPWPSNFIRFKVDVEARDVDGSKANRLLMKADGIEMGGGLSSIWSVIDGKQQSLKVRMIYQPSVKTWFYVYPKSPKIPVDNDNAFLAYAERIQKKADKNKLTPITFKTDDSGKLIIRPEAADNRTSIYYDPDLKLSDEMLEARRPRLFGNRFYQLDYSIERDEKELDGTLIFVDLGKWVFCGQMEAPDKRFNYFEQSMMDFISNFYLEEDGNDAPPDNQEEASELAENQAS